jgi:protein-disulfide isomerase
VGFAGVTLLSALVWQRIYFEAALRRPPEARKPDAGDLIAEYRKAPWNDLPVSEVDPHLGPLSAPVRLVVFESFRCPGCRTLAGTLSRLRDTFGDRLLVVYKHYPLSTECNRRLTRDMQPGACEIAWAAEAANRQRSFWPFHDALFAADARDPASGIADAARSVRLDAARFASDRRSDSTLARVATDIALGDRLQIPGTPAVFVDGRLVPSTDHRVLETLIRHVLGEPPAGQPRSSPDVVGTDRPAIRGRSSRGG